MHRRGEAQECADFFLLRFLLRARARTEALDFPLFEAEVRGRAVGEEIVTVSDEIVVQLMEEFFGGSAFAGVVAIDAGPAGRPFGTPVEGADDAIGITRGETGLPLVHPFGVAAEHTKS